jgi:hypothetical protein
MDTDAECARVADIYVRAVSKAIRRKAFLDPESKNHQQIRLMLAFCAELEVTPELFIKAQLETVGHFFQRQRIMPRFGMFVSEKALGRLVRYLEMLARSYELKPELKEVLDQLSVAKESDYWQALIISADVIHNRLKRLNAMRLDTPLDEASVLAEIEMMARAGLVSNIYVALHRLSPSNEYLASVRTETLEKLSKEIGNAQYLSNLRQAVRSHLVTEEKYAVLAEWLL